MSAFDTVTLESELREIVLPCAAHREEVGLLVEQLVGQMGRFKLRNTPNWWMARGLDKDVPWDEHNQYGGDSEDYAWWSTLFELPPLE